MSRKRYKPEQMVNLLRQVEVAIGQLHLRLSKMHDDLFAAIAFSRHPYPLFESSQKLQIPNYQLDRFTGGIYGPIPDARACRVGRCGTRDACIYPASAN